ncbi:MAG: DMT family transporter [Bacilli bacterium]|jgi:drug/metabolite transporter (DMT)-like permease|nr:DMT family transporter [Bacilli bacterium]
MKTWQANIALLIVTMIWGLGFVATDEALKFLPPMQMQIFRFGIAAIIMMIVFYKKLIKASKKAIIYGLVIGTIFFIGMTLQTFGLKDSTVPKNAFLTVTNVVFVPLIAFVLYKRIPKNYLWYGIFVMLIGFFFLLFQFDIFNISNSIQDLKSQSHITFGDFLSLLCGFAFAFHFIAAEKFVKDEDPIVIVMFQLIVSTILSIILAFFIEGNPANLEVNNFVLALPSLLYMAIFSSIISFILQLVAQKYVPASNTAVICTLESMFAAIFAVILGRTALSSSLIIGGLLITIGIIWAETGFNFKDEIHE